MAVVTRLRTQMEAPRELHYPGEAPQPPDKWYAKLRRVGLSNKSTDIPNTIAVQSPGITVRGQTLHSTAGSSSLSASKLAEKDTSTSSATKKPRDHGDALVKPLEGTAPDYLQSSGVEYPDLAAEVNLTEPQVIVGPSRVTEVSAPIQTALPSSSFRGVRSSEVDESLQADGTSVVKFEPVLDLENVGPGNKAQELRLSQQERNNAPPQSTAWPDVLSEEEQLSRSKGKPGFLKHPEDLRDGRESDERRGSRASRVVETDIILSPSSTLRDGAKSKTKPMVGNTLAANPSLLTWESQQHERQQFDDDVAPWIQSLLRHRVAGLGINVRIRTELEHIPDKASARRYFTIVIICSGLKAKKIREIESILAKHIRVSGLEGFNWIVREGKAFSFRGAWQEFSNAALWRPDAEPSIDIALPQNFSTLCGAPIQIQRSRGTTETNLVSWTCGGLVLVNGKLFGITTAHPMVLNRSEGMRADDSSDELYDDAQGDEDDMRIEADPLLWKPYKIAGQVARFALSQCGVVPDNCDWLLFEVGNSLQLPNEVRGPSAAFSKYITMSKGPQLPGIGTFECAIYTSHGIVTASSASESSFLIIGDSAFKSFKLNLSRPLKYGDSGAWVIRQTELIGVLIAADDDSSTAFAIRFEDVMKSISAGMDEAMVELPSALDNDIIYHRLNNHDRYQELLLYSYILKLLSMEGHGKLLRKAVPRSEIQPAVAEISAYLAIGQLMHLSVDRLQWFLHRHRHNTLLPFNRKSRIVGQLAKLHHGQGFISFVSWFTTARLLTIRVEDRLDYLTLLILELCNEIGVGPTCIPSTNEIHRVLHDIAFGWSLTSALYSKLRRRSPASPLQVHDILSDVPAPATAAKILSKLLSFNARTSFYIYEGRYAGWLGLFVSAEDKVWVHGIQAAISSIWQDKTRRFPRVILRHDASDDRPERSAPYGKIVEYAELNEMLQKHLPQEAERSNNDRENGDEKKLRGRENDEKQRAPDTEEKKSRDRENDGKQRRRDNDEKQRARDDEGKQSSWP